MTPSAQVVFKPGDVLLYIRERYHCREVTAFVRDDGAAVDTYWHPYGDGESHRLTDVELASATVAFNVNDYDALDRYAGASRPTWETHHPGDRGRITSQHGLQETLFIRKGAKPDLGTQIENAQARVERAEADLRSAQSTLEWRRAELAELEASHVAS